MLNYKTFKESLQQTGRSTKYFTSAFFNTFCKEWKEAIEAVESGTFNHDTAYAETRKSRFYIENGTTYCYFLEMIYTEKNKALLTGKDTLYYAA